MRRTLARSHNWRVIILGLAIIATAGIDIQTRWANGLYISLGLAIAVAVAGLVYVLHAAARQSLALGFVCPRCGGSLYDRRDNRLGQKGECPRCKAFIIDELRGEQGAETPIPETKLA
ncbi:MAG TPA: hypothetical protein VK961_27270 [Chthoniobacter sp.]|nr:hypothetical protein [Chthoniobacter sp.]